MKLTKKQQTFNELTDLLWKKGYELYQVGIVEQNQLRNLEIHNLPKTIYYVDILFDDCPEELKKYHWYDKLFLNKSAAFKFYKLIESKF